MLVASEKMKERKNRLGQVSSLEELGQHNYACFNSESAYHHSNSFCVHFTVALT